MSGFVYFMRQIGGGGPVKIGHSGNPAKRLPTYNAIAPYPLAIVAQMAGSVALESRLHTHLRHLRSHHEWFHAAPELEAIIAEVAGGTFDPASIPEAKDPYRSKGAAKGWIGRREREAQRRADGTSWRAA